MSEPFLGEVKLCSFHFAPKGWALCNGQLLPINQNQALFALLGTQYGGDGRVNFALPDLRGRTPIHVGNGHTQGERGGEASVTLTTQQMPQHMHLAMASGSAATASAASQSGTSVMAIPGANIYGTAGNPVTLNPGAIANSGGSQAHNNMQPSTVLSFCIALQGIFPSQH